MRQRSGVPWGKIAILACASFVIGADGFMLAAVLTQVAEQLGVSVGQTGLLVTVFAWVYAIFAPLSGMLMSRCNRRTTLLCALILFIVGNSIAAIAPSYGWMMVARVVAALGSAMAMPTAMTLATSLAPAHHRGKAISVVTTGMTMATVLAVPLGSFVGERYGFRLLFWAMAVFAAVVIVGILVGIRYHEAPASPHRSTPGHLLAGFTNRQVRLTLLVTIVVFMAGMGVTSYLSTVVKQAGLSDQFSLVLLVFGLGSLLGGGLGGWLADRVKSVWLVRWAMIIFAGSLLLLALAASLLGAGWLVYGSVLGWTVSAWVVSVAQQYRLVAMAPVRAQLNLSLNSSAVYIGQGCGGVLGAVVISHWSAHMIPLVASGAVVVALAMTSRYETIPNDDNTTSPID